MNNITKLFCKLLSIGACLNMHDNDNAIANINAELRLDNLTFPELQYDLLAAHMSSVRGCLKAEIIANSVVPPREVTVAYGADGNKHIRIPAIEVELIVDSCGNVTVGSYSAD